MWYRYMMLITYILIINLTIGYKSQNEKIGISSSNQCHACGV